MQETFMCVTHSTIKRTICNTVAIRHSNDNCDTLVRMSHAVRSNVDQLYLLKICRNLVTKSLFMSLGIRHSVLFNSQIPRGVFSHCDSCEAELQTVRLDSGSCAPNKGHFELVILPCSMSIVKYYKCAIHDTRDLSTYMCY